MRLLLDTSIIIVASRTPDRLSVKARAALLDPSIERYVSLVSLWEIAIKRGAGKLTFSDADIDQTLLDLTAEELPIRRRHVLAGGSLPFHHRDPFDRLLIAQAQAEDLTLVTSDRQFAAYGVRLLPA